MRVLIVARVLFVAVVFISAAAPSAVARLSIAMGSKPSKRSDKDGVVQSGKKKRASPPPPSVGSQSNSSVSDYPMSTDHSGVPDDAPVAPASRSNGNAGGILGRDHTGVNGARATVAGGELDDDDRPFHEERVVRVPTKAVLKPPKNAGSVIADPDADDDYLHN